jgi:hypothetical protein
MHHAPCVWQVPHEATGAAGVIEVHVRQKNVVNIGDVKILPGEGVQQKWDAAVNAGVNIRGTTFLDDQMARIVQQAHIFSINRDDAVVKNCYL